MLSIGAHAQRDNTANKSNAGSGVVNGRSSQGRIFAGATIVLAVAGVVVGSQSALADASPPTAAEKYAMNVRGQFGLENDLAYVRSLEHQPGLDTIELGTPLTPEEAAQMVSRQGVAQYANEVGDALASRRDYGGIWEAQRGNGGVVIALTSSPTSSVRSLVSSIVPSKYSVEYVKVGTDLTTLQTLADKISSSPLDDSHGEPLWLTVSANAMSNIVEVGVLDQAHKDLIYQNFGHVHLSVSVIDPPRPLVGHAVSDAPVPGGAPRR